MQISPDMIDSFIHHSGGPIFFALSMIPFLLFLYLLWKTEPKRSAAATPSPETAL